VVDDEPGARPEALGAEAQLVVAREDEHIRARARLHDLALDPAPARDHL
jgi:hypothetical protein